MLKDVIHHNDLPVVLLVHRCHGRVAGRTRETRGKVNKGNFNNRTQDTPLCRRVNGQRLRGNSGLINT